MGWVPINFELLALAASFDVISDKGVHSRPVYFFFSQSVSFLFSRMSGGGVVVVSLGDSSAEIQVVWYDDSVVVCHQVSI